MEKVKKWAELPKIKKVKKDDILLYGGKDKCVVVRKISIQTDCNSIVNVAYEIKFEDGAVEFWNKKGIKSFFIYFKDIDNLK